MDARVGGTHRMSFTNFSTGKSHSFGGTYLELTPHERIRYTDKFDDPNLPGEMQTTIALKSVSVGTEMSVVRKACLLSSQPRLAISAGRNRSPCLRSSWRPRFRISSTILRNDVFRTAREVA